MSLLKVDWGQWIGSACVLDPQEEAYRHQDMLPCLGTNVMINIAEPMLRVVEDTLQGRGRGAQ